MAGIRQKRSPVHRRKLLRLQRKLLGVEHGVVIGEPEVVRPAMLGLSKTQPMETSHIATFSHTCVRDNGSRSNCMDSKAPPAIR